MKITKEEQAIYQDFEFCGKNAKKWMHKCVLMLPKIEKMRIWEKKGFLSIYEFAAKLAGMSRNKVNEGLRILKKTENMPEIQKLIENKGIWVVKSIVRVVTPENQKFWANKAMTMKKNTLETYVREMEENARAMKFNGNGEGNGCDNGCGESVGFGDNSDRPGAGNPLDSGLSKLNLFQKAAKITVSMKLDPEVVEMLGKLKGTSDWNTVMKDLLESHKKETQREQQEIEAEKPAKVQITSRPVPLKIQKYIKARAKGKCEAPNCTKPGKYLHHTTPFALKKEHDPDKIRLLCEAHHDIAHHGLIQNEDEQPQNWKIQKFPDLTDFKTIINARIAKFRRVQNIA